MKKIYLLLLTCVVLTGVNAQRGRVSKVHLPKFETLHRLLLSGLPSSCDTLNVADSTWGGMGYYNVGTDNGGGFVTGTNGYGDLAKGQYYDASALTDNYLTKTWIAFAVAGINASKKIVPVNVYDCTGGNLGALLGTTNLTMQTIINDVADSQYTEVVFNPSIQLPASKQFLIGVDMSNLTWSQTEQDSLAIYSSQWNMASGAWEQVSQQFGGGWYPFPDDWDEDLGLYMIAFTSTNAVCGALPVHLTSFTAQAKGSDVLVNWQVTQELNMKEYDVERAGSNLQFVTAGTVVATNAQLDHAYSFTDAGAAATAGGLFYRLKQVNKDGSFTYSNIIKVNTNSGILTVGFANPVTNVVQLHINSPVVQKLQAGIYDLLGRKVATLNEQVLTAGDNFITMPTGNLPKGVYILNLSAGGTAYKYKIVTQ